MTGRVKPLIVMVVIGAVAVGIGALVSWVGEGRQAGADVSGELAALRTAESKRAGGTKAPARPALCRTLTTTTVGQVSDDALDELSGLVRSPTQQGRFWAIEDSGADPVLTALNTNGTSAGNWTVSGGSNVDWEDVAAGPGPYLYAADIGDNRAARDSVSVYRVPEPSGSGGGQTAPAQRLELRYPDGAHDAESLLIDPKRGTLIVITKGLTGGGVYSLPKRSAFAGTATLRKSGAVPVSFATAADVSADGKIVAVRGYTQLAVWARKGSEPLTETLRRRPCVSPTDFRDGQGEAIALSADGRTAWTVAEGQNPPILRLRPR